MWNGKSVTVVLPCFNEEPNIGKAASEFLAIEAVDEVLVVDNNSTDRTAEEANRAGARVITETRQGYGFAIRGGLEKAEKDLVVICEPDGTFVPEDIYKLLSYSADFD